MHDASEDHDSVDEGPSDSDDESYDGEPESLDGGPSDACSGPESCEEDYSDSDQEPLAEGSEPEEDPQLVVSTGVIQVESFQEAAANPEETYHVPDSSDSESESATATMPRSGGGGGGRSGGGGGRSSSGCYVDNAANRSLGRVGMAYGTAVVRLVQTVELFVKTCFTDSFSFKHAHLFNFCSSSGGGSSYGGSSYGGYGGYGSGASSSSSRTYVDNASNRSLGRVGMPVGSAVVSRSAALKTVFLFTP